MSAGQLDPSFVRGHFPALQNPPYPDHLHFENAGGSYPCGFVIDRLTRFFRERKVQPYYSAPQSAAGGQEMDEARARLSALLNIPAQTLSFGPSTTQNSYVLAQAFGQMLRPGDAIVVTNQDHEANSGPWRRLAGAGIELREWRADPQTGELARDALLGVLDDKVRLVCFPHCSNILGVLNPVAELCALIREAGAFSCVDGVSAAPHGFPDIAGLGADIYLFSAYKTFGPHQGLMYVAPELSARLPNQGHYFNADKPSARFTPAGPDHAQIAACAGMADYVDALADHLGCAGDPAPARARKVAAAQRARETALIAPLMDFLRARNDIRLLGPASAGGGKVGTVSFAHDRPGAVLEKRMVEAGIMCGGGSFYANRLLEGLGIDPAHGVLRVSFTHYTDEAEIAALISALDRVLGTV